MFFGASRWSVGLSVAAALFGLTGLLSSASARERKEPVFATSANDLALRNRLIALSPDVRPEEAHRVAQCAYNTGRELKREWRVAWPPGFHNFLVNTGARKGGLCYQWAGELLLRLDALKLETLELHWAESYVGTISEHNVIVVTARGQPMAQGILLDNWRYGGRLIWGRASADREYHWLENKPEAVRRLKKTGPVAPARTSRETAAAR